MLSKSIWYVNHYAAGPGINGAYRAYELSKAWIAQGHNARVIHASIQTPNQSDPFPENQIIDGVPYTAVRTNRYSGNGIGRLLSMALFAKRLNHIAKAIPDDAPKPDAIIISTVHPFGIYAGRRLARKYGAKLVFEIRDFWPLTLITLLKTSKWHPFIIACDVTEKYALKHADLVASVLPRAPLYFDDFNRPVKDFIWVPNGVSEVASKPDVKDAPITQRAEAFVKTAKDNGRTVIGYAGAMGPPNAVLRLVKALEQATVKDRKTLAVLAIGDGVQRDTIQSRLEGLSGLSVHFTGFVSKASAQSLLRCTDFGYGGGTVNAQLYRYGISPNKLASYMQAGLPVLLPMYPCGDPVSESGGGIAAPLASSDEMLGAIMQLRDMGPEARRDMRAKGHAFIAAHYDYPEIAKRYFQAIFKQTNA